MRYLFALLFISCLVVSCTKDRHQEIGTEPKTVIIAGKVINPLPHDSIIGFSINRVGFDQEAIETSLSQSGNFRFEFEAYVSLDGWLSYQTNFLVAAHPGDSIYIEFDGASDDRTTILETIKLSGDAVTLNREITEFQKRYFTSELVSNETDETKEKAVKEFDTNQFKSFTDSLGLEGEKFFNLFVKEVSPSAEAKSWAKAFVDREYYSDLSFYADSHRKAQVMKQSEWDVPLSYYDYFLEPYSISNALTSAYATSSYSGLYTYRYIRENTKAVLKNLTGSEIKVKTSDESIPLHVQDSVSIQMIVNKTSDPLLKQISLTYFFHNLLLESEIETFERNRRLIDEQITQPFLKQPLLKEYDQLKATLDEIALNKGIQMQKDKINNAQTAVDDIMQKNKGKVIYIDIWATWCAPCRQEFPYSQKLEEQFSGDVAFAFICVDSSEKAYLNALKKYQLSGQHYFLDEPESKKIMEKYALQGIPHYILIDKNGEIALRGYKIKPSEDATASKIKALL